MSVGTQQQKNEKTLRIIHTTTKEKIAREKETKNEQAAIKSMKENRVHVNTRNTA